MFIIVAKLHLEQLNLILAVFWIFIIYKKFGWQCHHALRLLLMAKGWQ
jgi:hypothetical protein